MTTFQPTIQDTLKEILYDREMQSREEKKILFIKMNNGKPLSEKAMTKYELNHLSFEEWHDLQYQYLEEEEDDVVCVGCNEFVCKFNEEPKYKDDRDEAVCENCHNYDEEYDCGCSANKHNSFMMLDKNDDEYYICQDCIDEHEEQGFRLAVAQAEQPDRKK